VLWQLERLDEEAIPLLETEDQVSHLSYGESVVCVALLDDLHHCLLRVVHWLLGAVRGVVWFKSVEVNTAAVTSYSLPAGCPHHFVTVVRILFLVCIEATRDDPAHTVTGIVQLRTVVVGHPIPSSVIEVEASERLAVVGHSDSFPRCSYINADRRVNAFHGGQLHTVKRDVGLPDWLVIPAASRTVHDSTPQLSSEVLLRFVFRLEEGSFAQAGGEPRTVVVLAHEELTSVISRD